MLYVVVLFQAGGGPPAKPAEERLGSAKLDFAEQIGREDVEPGEKPDASRTRALQAEHLPLVRQTEVAAETVATGEAGGGARRGRASGNSPMSFRGLRPQGKAGGTVPLRTKYVLGNHLAFQFRGQSSRNCRALVSVSFIV